MSAHPGHVQDLVDDFVLELLEPSRSAIVERHLDECAECRAVVHLTRETLGQLALALPPMAPSAGLWDRLARRLSLGGRFEPFAIRVAELLDLAVDHVRGLLERIDDPDVWSQGPSPTSRLFHLDGGPRLARAIAGFVKVTAGSRFPDHTHYGEERVLVLQGSLVDESGQILREGDEAYMPPLSHHDFVAAEGRDLIYLVTILGEVDIGGIRIKPGDPRM